MKAELDPEVLDGCAAACAFLASALLSSRGAQLVASLAEPGLLDAWPLPSQGAQAGLQTLRRAVAEPLPAERYDADYRALFVGPGSMLACPYESVHRSAEGLTFDVQTLQVRQRYAAFGFAAPALNNRPDDHIGLELHFVAELALAALDALEVDQPERAQDAMAGIAGFVADHLATWAPGLASMIADRASTDLYRGVGLLLGATVADLAVLFGRPAGEAA